MPSLSLHPEVVVLIFLPPILYSAAWNTSWPDFKKAKRPITLLAIGCVIFTTCAVAWIAHTFIPNVGWPEAFVLGAIISPPDAIAAAASTKGLSVPKRVITILEGESLVNDATRLISSRPFSRRYWTRNGKGSLFFATRGYHRGGFAKESG